MMYYLFVGISNGKCSPTSNYKCNPAPWGPFGPNFVSIAPLIAFSSHDLALGQISHLLNLHSSLD